MACRIRNASLGNGRWPPRGDGLQIVDVAKRRYANESLFGGSARVTLEATFTGERGAPRRSAASDSCCLAIKSLSLQFPPGVERTWCLSYTDASCAPCAPAADRRRSNRPRGAARR